MFSNDALSFLPSLPLSLLPSLFSLCCKALKRRDSGSELAIDFIQAAEKMLEDDLAANKSMGDYGADLIIENYKATTKTIRVITHCNTGSLATAGYGTALGVIRSLHTKGVLEHVFCTETRPYNQVSYSQSPTTRALITEPEILSQTQKRGLAWLRLSS